MKKPFLLFAFLSVVALTGCATKTFGPVVTSVTLDANGNLVVERNILLKHYSDTQIAIGDKPTVQVLHLAKP